MKYSVLAVVSLQVLLAANANACGEHKAVSGKLLELTCAFDLAEGKAFDKKYAQKRAQEGSPLIVQADDGTIYFPIPAKETTKSQAQRWMDNLGQRIRIEGDLFECNNMKVIAPDSVKFE